MRLEWHSYSRLRRVTPLPIRRSVVRESSAVSDPTVRVCVVAPSLGILGGQAVQAIRLIEHLNAEGGVQVDLLPVNPALPGILGHLQSIKYVRTIVTSVRYVASLLIRLPRYDVVHVFSASYWSFVLAPLPALLIGRLYGKRTILNYHSGEADDHLRRWPSAVRAMRLAHEVIVPSRYLVDVMARFGVRARAIFNFVDIERIPYRRRHLIRPRILTNRNLEPLYNVACVLRAFARVQREHPDAHLVVAGFGSQRAALESLAHELALRNVSFVGRVAADGMGRLYDEADLFVNGSNVDNMPLSILDAFAAGTPVVTTDAGGIPYVVRDGVTGFVAEREDDAALAAGVLRLLSDHELALCIADAARADCLANYVWPKVRDQWVNLYRSLAGGVDGTMTRAASGQLEPPAERMADRSSQ
jgi:glycosyltransferase involved in cell wall biosynthesis